MCRPYAVRLGWLFLLLARCDCIVQVDRAVAEVRAEEHVGQAAVAVAGDAVHVVAAAQTHNTWRDYGGAPDSAQYSALSQINRSNVNKLQVAWTFPTSDGQPYALPARRTSPTVGGSMNSPFMLPAPVGGRSERACAFLAQQGFTNVKNLIGGIDAWSVKVDPSVPRY